MDRENADQEFGLEGSFTANSYLDTLERGLIPIYEGQAFQQDNALIHTAGKVHAFFNNLGIYYIKDWPLYSPDLNPIEHL